MATANRWRLFQVLVDDTVDVPIRGITNFEMDPGIEAALIGGDGYIERTHAHVKSVRPMVEFDTMAIVAALTKIPYGGMRITSSVPIVLTFARMDRLGIETGSVHKKVTVNAGLIVPTMLRLRQGEDANLHYQIWAEHDGSVSPYVVTNAQALPAQTMNTEVFTLGPVKINGTALAGVQEVEVNFGNTVTATGDGGSLAYTFTGIDDRDSNIVVTSTDLGILDTYGGSGAANALPVGTAQGATDSLVYLRKRALDAGLVADATAEHVSIAVDGGIIVPQRVTQPGGHINIGLRIAPRRTNAALPLDFNLATAIT